MIPILKARRYVPPHRQLQGYLAHPSPPPTLGPPKSPRHMPTAGSSGGGVSSQRGSSVGTSSELVLTNFRESCVVSTYGKLARNNPKLREW